MNAWTAVAARGPAVARWLARGLSVSSVGLIVLFLIGERPNVIAVIRSTHGLFLAFPVGLCIGLVLAWRWELAGGLLALASMTVFCVVHVVQAGRWPRGPTFPMLLLPAMLFLASWGWRRAVGRRSA